MGRADTVVVNVPYRREESDGGAPSDDQTNDGAAGRVGSGKSSTAPRA
jgi:hypothetical protein